MVKGILIGVIGCAVVGLIGAFVVVETGAVPTNANTRPSALERWAATTALHARVERDAPRGGSPLPATPENLAAGLKIYSTVCVDCHGAADGRASDIAKGLYQEPPQLAKHGVEDDPVGETFWKAKYGIRWTGMPAFDPTLSTGQLWAVALFLKHMNSLPPEVEAKWRSVPSVASPSLPTP